MLHSMTGYGSNSFKVQDLEIDIEVKSAFKNMQRNRQKVCWRGYNQNGIKCSKRDIEILQEWWGY